MCPTRYRTRHFFNNFTTNEDIATTTDTFLFISHTTKVIPFKFRCNIFSGVKIIKEMPGSVVRRDILYLLLFRATMVALTLLSCLFNILRYVRIHIPYVNTSNAPVLLVNFTTTSR